MKRDIKELFSKYGDNTITEAELALLETWYLRWAPEFEEIDMEKLEALEQEIYATLPGPKKQIKLWPRIAVAASFLIIAGIALYFFNLKNNGSFLQTHQYVNDIAPARNAATLTLANGKKIVLSNAVKGELAKEGGISITKTAKGQIVYEITDQGHNTDPKNHSNVGLNSLTTANAQTYEIILPDQTKVWLNAASSLKYPSSFANLKERKVTLSGEAYFEVSKDKKHPFVVATDKQEVQVLGTHFNINSYADELVTKTTLLEGSVQVTTLGTAGNVEDAGKILKPGQQAVLEGHSLRIKTADIEAELAWKNGNFFFDNEDFESILRKVEKWYDVEFQYKKGSLENLKIWARVSRSKHISSVLEALQVTGKVKFKIEGRKIIVIN